MMNRNKAIELLAACKPLTDRMSVQGVNLVFTELDRTILAGFNRVYLGGWLNLDNESKVYEIAGLSYSDIRILNFMAVKEQLAKFQNQYAKGELYWF